MSLHKNATEMFGSEVEPNITIEFTPSNISSAN